MVLRKKTPKTILKQEIVKKWEKAGIKPGCGGRENYEKALELVKPEYNQCSWAMKFWVESWARTHVGGI